jgi:hypothetical protein
MFGVENLVLSRQLSETKANPNMNNSSSTSNPNESFVSINSDYDSSVSNLQYQNASFANSRADLANRLDSMAGCPAYLLPRLSYTNLSQSLIEKAESAAPTKGPPKSLSRNLSLKSNNSNSQSKFYYTDDFILLSEFSEIEGPKPLLTIPTDGGTGFNKNECSLHLMCVDFHSHLQFLQKPEPENGCKTFSLTRDTSIINYWDTNSTLVTACVQHFTLYDLDARGFVRPFCLAYISYDQKSIGFFDEIRAKFTEITDLFKKSNFNVFKAELEQRCIDLKFTREFFLKWTMFFDEQKVNVDPSREPNSEDDKFIKIINKMISDYKLDERTVARLNHSSSTPSAKQHQLETIDNMICEMENILSVVVDELKAKKWLKSGNQADSLAASRDNFNLNRH